MKRSWKEMTWGELAKLFGPFVGAFALGILLTFWRPCTWWLRDLVPVLRDALIVAGIIGFGLEAWSASVLIADTTEQLSERLIGYGLPRDAQYLIHELARDTWRVYREYHKVYRITRHNTPGNVTVYITVSYHVVNNGQSPQRYAPTLAEEGMYQPAVTKLEYDDAVIQTKRDVDNHTGVITFSGTKKVRLMPSRATDPRETLTREQCCTVRWEYTLEMPDYYSDVSSFGGVTIKPMIELSSIDDGLAFYASQGDEHKCLHADGGSTWLYDRAFITGQHVRAWWKPTTSA